jgi:MSHA biogenesis protein MshN
MSLINQVLKDLDHRRGSETPEPAVVLQHVRYTPTRAARKRSRLGLLGLLALSVMCIAAAVYYFMGSRQAEQARETAIIPVTALATVPPPIVSNNTMPLSTTPTSVQPAIPVVAPIAATPTTREESAPIVEAAPVVETKPAKSRKKSVVVVAEEEAADTPTVNKQAVPLAPAQSSAVTYQSAYELVSMNRLREAESLLRTALTRDPAQIQLRELLTGLYIKGGRWVEASEVLASGLQVTPNHTPFIKLQARTLMQLNQDLRAIEILVSRAPPVASDPEHHALLAALYQRQHNHLAAIKTYTEVLTVQPKAGVWWVGMAISLEALAKQPEAQAAYAQARATGGLAGEVARFTDNRIQVLNDLRLGSE